ncbi:MAG: substrate-binding domain-containing protein [Chloroflexota bacterium]
MFETPEYLYQEIAESFRRQIASGELAPGDKLPPIRKLASTWSCTPGTVSRAYRILADEGLVVSHRGKGTRVAANVLQRADRRGGEGGSNELRWARLINRAEQFLLEGVAADFSGSEVQAALTVALSRWRELQKTKDRSKAPAKDEWQLRFAGSHDLLVENVANVLMGASPPVEVELSFSGSLGGLMALLRGEADVAGCHLWDEQTDSYNVSYVERLLADVDVVMMTLVHRSLGLLVSEDMVGQVRALADLARSEVKMVNRQRGSGTRVWLDAHLRRENVDAADIAGYEREVTTHIAVAQAVADGRANVGPGIHAAAAAYGLGFVPLTKERYDLVFLQNVWESPAAVAFVEYVRSDAFKRLVESMGGYDSRESGQVRQV